MTENFERLATEPPLGALAASRSLHRSLVTWQATLVEEALQAGASWEDVGEALGTTRQAAWARFRQDLEEGGKGGMEEHQQQFRQQLDKVRNSGQARLRELDSQWRQERDRLQEELEAGRRRLKEAKQRHARDRRAARDYLRSSLAALKTEARSR